MSEPERVCCNCGEKRNLVPLWGSCKRCKQPMCYGCSQRTEQCRECESKTAASRKKQEIRQAIRSGKTVCEVCGRVRGKNSIYEWKPCRGCGKTLCYNCNETKHQAGMSECRKCSSKRCERECNERRARERNTPVECKSCHRKKLPRYFENKYVPSVCKVCARKEREVKEQTKKSNAQPGVVVVVYGEHPVPTEDGGHGYSYCFDGSLGLGDVVEVPRTWLGSLKGQSGPNLATVVSTYSDYDGPVSRIIRVVRRATER